MIKAYEARKIADSFDRTKDLMEEIEKQIKHESQSGNYKLNLRWFHELYEADVNYVVSVLETNGYKVNYKTEIVWGNAVNIFDIMWERGELNEIKS